MREFVDMVNEFYPTSKEKVKLVVGAVFGAVFLYVTLVVYIGLFG